MRYKTKARRAEEALNQIIGPENRIYRAWQLEDYIVEPLRIEGTIDDVLLLANNKAYARPGFKTEDNRVTVPNLFVKFNGDVKGFYLDMKQLQSDRSDIVTIYDTFKRMAAKPRKTPLISKPSWYNPDGGIDVDAALAAGIGNLQVLRPGYQRNYLLALNRVLARVKSDAYLAERPTDRTVIETLLFNSNKIIRMFHKFDYQYVNPKFIVLEESGLSINAFAVLRLMMMDALGFDVFILSKEGYASIENYLSDDICKQYFLTAREQVYSLALQRRRKMLHRLAGFSALLLAAGVALMIGVKLSFGF